MTPVCTVYVLPGLGFAGEAAAPIAAHLPERFDVVGIDLPGHGDAPDAADAGVAAVADAVVAAIAARATGGPWILCGHSMGGKIAAVVADRVLRGDAPLFGLAGLVLLAPSPTTREPMDEERRERMLAWVADGPISAQHAHDFVSENVAAPLDPDTETTAIAQVQRMSPLAWRRWLETGSRQDVRDGLDIADLPAVVLAGDADDDLGADAQPGLITDLLPRAEVIALSDTGHLLPYERPREVAAAIARLWERILAASAPVPSDWGRIIASERTDPETRGILSRRALADDVDAGPQALTPLQLTMLRALAARLVPRAADDRFDLALRLDRDLAEGRGDGWRPPGLPTDADAARAGLDALAAVWPDGTAAQDALIAQIIAGDGFDGSPWDADTTRRWFEDVRVDLAQAWVSHPASSARIAFDGFVTGVGTSDPGFSELRADRRDAWEPPSLGILSSTEDPS
ncbi:alpha/beta fold hydrolase [Microbacterium aurantiacum]|uniref:alpha/beta fold hydrolase n=1 Tax=Microbacterium aurantiacum TaxID=162393 RepID=UPI004036EC81